MAEEPSMKPEAEVSANEAKVDLPVDATVTSKTDAPQQEQNDKQPLTSDINALRLLTRENLEKAAEQGDFKGFLRSTAAAEPAEPAKEKSVEELKPVEEKPKEDAKPADVCKVEKKPTGEEA